MKATAMMIKGAFPGRDRLIEQAIADHASFRDLCEDYRRCASALERWRQADGAVHASRRREYEELLAELANEVEGWIDALASEPSRPDGTAAE